MSDSVELKFPVVAHHRLIVDAARRDDAATAAAFAGFELVEPVTDGRCALAFRPRRGQVMKRMALAVACAVVSLAQAGTDWKSAFREAGFDPEAEGSSFFIVTSDIHATRAHEKLAGHVAAWNAMRPRPAFVAHLGDFGDLNQYFGDRPSPETVRTNAAAHFGAIRKILCEGLDRAISRVFVVGNHDTYPGEKDRATWRRYFPDQPTHCAFDACGMRFLKWDGGGDGGIDAEQEAWIGEQVRATPNGRQIAVLVHQPGVGSIGCERDIGRVSRAHLGGRGLVWMLAGHSHGNRFKVWDLPEQGTLAVATHTMNRNGWWMYGVKDGQIVARVFCDEQKSGVFSRGEMPDEVKSCGTIPLAYEGRDDVIWKAFVGSEDERACRVRIAETGDNDTWFYYVGTLDYRFPKAKVASKATRFAILGTLIGKRFKWTPATLSMSADGQAWTVVKRSKVEREVNEFPIPVELVGAAELHVRYEAYGMDCDECIAGFAFLE